MQFVRDKPLPPPKVKRMRWEGPWCLEMPKPNLELIHGWRGHAVLQAIVDTRAGVVEAVDFDLLTPGANHFIVQDLKEEVIKALAGYRCEGDYVFVQQFAFQVK